MNSKKYLSIFYNFYCLIFLLVIIFSINACGGGGGGGDNPTPTPTPEETLSVTSTSPSGGATDISVSNPITVVFNSNIDSSTVNASSFSVINAQGSAVPGTLSVSGATVAFAPTGTLEYKNLHKVTVTTAIKNASGKSLSANSVFSFTTRAKPQNVDGIAPANGSSGIELTSPVIITFNQDVDISTVTANSIFVKNPSGTAVTGTLSCQQDKVTFTPAGNYGYATTYTVTVKSSVKSTDGKMMPSDFNSTFITRNRIPLSVSSIIPANGAQGVLLNATVTVTFNTALNPATVTASSFTLKAGATPVDGNRALDATGKILTFTPSSSLVLNTIYTVTITTDVQNTEGGTLPSDYISFFSTKAEQPFHVESVTPANEATDVPLNAQVVVTFSQAPDGSTANLARFTVEDTLGNPVSGSKVVAGNTITFTPSVNYQYLTEYVITLQAALANATGDETLGNDYLSYFTTRDHYPLDSPTTVPDNGEIDVPVSSTVSIDFDMPIDFTTVTSANIYLKDNDDNLVSGALSQGSSSKIVIFTPGASLKKGIAYTLTVTTDVKNTDGGCLPDDFQMSFTTVQPRWNTVGAAAFSDGQADSISLAIAGGVPYVAYQDIANSGVAAAMSFDGSSWQKVGTGGIMPGQGQAFGVSLAIDGGIPYMAFRDFVNGNKATVMKYESGSWEVVGSSGFTSGRAYNISLAVSGGIPYVAYVDQKGDEYNATVMKYEGGTWQYVGTEGFSAGEVQYTSIALYGGVPYVAYEDFANGNRVTVMKYDLGSSAWQAVGDKGFSEDEAENVSLAIAGDGTLYVSYKNKAKGYKASVMKYDGSAWVYVGNAGLSAGQAEYISLAVYDGTPYLAYQDWANDHKATVMKYIELIGGGVWLPLDMAGFTPGQAEYTSLAVYGGTPYLAYQDVLNSGKCTVVKFD